MSTPIPPQELERRLLCWAGSSLAPRYPFFDGNLSISSSSHSSLQSSYSNLSQSLQDLPRWFHDVELAATDCNIPKGQYPEVAIYFLTGDLKDVMNQRKDVYIKQTRKRFWDWDDFKQDFKRIVDQAAKLLSNTPISQAAGDIVIRLSRTHPFIAASIGLGLIVGGTAILLPALSFAAWNRKLANEGSAMQITSSADS